MPRVRRDADADRLPGREMALRPTMHHAREQSQTTVNADALPNRRPDDIRDDPGKC